MKTLTVFVQTACLALVALLVTAGEVWACPFCVPVQQTFTEEMDVSDAVAIVELTYAPPVDTTGGDEKLERSQFKIVKVLKGEKHLTGDEPIELLYYGEGKLGDHFLMMGVDPPKLAWSSPTLLTERSEQYIHHLGSLPSEGAERLAFFQDYLEDKEEMLARDAYDEFARASYEAVINLKDQMNHAQLVSWIKDADIPASRRRLYLTMLGVCGDRNDADMLEGMLRGDDRKLRSGLDAMIACYLTLRKADGLALIEELYLKNKEAEYADTYSAIMALRFHGEETDVIPRERITQSMHHMLDRPELADLVIVDLARWEDWSVMGRLVELFKNADDKSSWVRVPVVRYLLACPKDEAKKHLEELEKIDEGAVRRAKTFFPFDEKEEATSAWETESKEIVTVSYETHSDMKVAEDRHPKTENQAANATNQARQPKRSQATAAPTDFSSLYTTGAVLLAGALIATAYGLSGRFMQPQSSES